MKIAIDYDDTITPDQDMWMRIILIMLNKGHDVRIVTFRSKDGDNTDLQTFLFWIKEHIPVIYTSGNLKADYCKEHEDWEPDVWIDDNPHWIGTKDEIL